MRRWIRPERAEFTYQMRLICVAIRVGELSPSEHRSHRGLLPGSRETSEPFEPLRRRPNRRHETSLKMSRRDAKLPRELDHGHRSFRAEQPIDRADDEPVRALRLTPLLFEQSFERRAILRGLELWVAAKPLRHASVALRSESAERGQLVREVGRCDAEEPCGPGGMEPDAERAHLSAVPHGDSSFEETNDNSGGLPPSKGGAKQGHGISQVDHDLHVGIGQNRR